MIEIELALELGHLVYKDILLKTNILRSVLYR